MIYQAPSGARDLLPLDVARKRWIEQRLQQVFHGWGYHRMITPTLEHMKTLTAGGAVQPETVIQVWDADEGLLGLRPELTASIARAAVTRLAAGVMPQRLYYNANVFRRQTSVVGSSQHEFFQAGVELLGGEGLRADAEVLLLLADCLTAVGLPHWHLVLGEAGLTRSLLSFFPADLRQSLRQAIAQMDWLAVAQLPLEPGLRERALSFFDLRGTPAMVLQQVSDWGLDPAQQDALHNLKSLVELLEAHPSITLDLSLLQTFDYYTGIVFEVVSAPDGGQRVLGQGGRYDQLLSLYHPQGEALPGIGFSLNIEDLQQVLLPLGKLPQQTAQSEWLVAAVADPTETDAAIAAAFHHAQILRAATPGAQRVEVELCQRSPADTRRYAQERRIHNIAWVHADGSVQTEGVTSAATC
ncbi:ATP phosphoribosyltransferase regulatory subunit [Synechococcales cyanobacterium C]|uniref:ATP phosphoribosyltransferase regulatory subunit n=1 Tax=Petrachloros mirabilis ULC683 TaxID=2781853 RepID=A0A8K1ZZ86_9CYAN|nr:ATP phosphoribosyltransferase regulatory subunit [Petrachloros mirabilis]NCJ06852.1 ATP phosphoribosyltransferase regulatory subunit [Petrachloros mirabilis ULC683]